MTSASLARRLWALVEPIHAVVYFSPEPLAALRAAGYRGFWMGYFAARAAPLGPASPELVRALFHNFAAARVEAALPAAWGFASPESALRARLDGSLAALRRHLGPLAYGDEVARLAGVLEEAARTAPPEGRPLYAANSALPWPTDPLGRLWHATTLLREHRGDGHVAALTAAGIGGREAHVVQALWSGAPRSVYRVARDLDATEWQAHLDALGARGLAADGRLTDAGRATKQEVEDRTDDLAAAAWSHLDDAGARALETSLRPLAAAVVASGELPLDSPMGLDLRPLVGSGPCGPARRTGNDPATGVGPA